MKLPVEFLFLSFSHPPCPQVTSAGRPFDVILPVTLSAPGFDMYQASILTLLVNGCREVV